MDTCCLTKELCPLIREMGAQCYDCSLLMSSTILRTRYAMPGRLVSLIVSPSSQVAIGPLYNVLVEEMFLFWFTFVR